MTVEFGELPPGPTPGYHSYWRDVVVEELKARPGEWAKVSTHTTENGAVQSAGRLRRGDVPGTKPGEFETVHRGLDVWARYVGGES